MISVKCPHCNSPVIIQKINCGIFRHGIIIKTGKQIKPHSNKTICDFLSKNNLIYGCGKPFRIINNTHNYEAIICDYI